MSAADSYPVLNHHPRVFERRDRILQTPDPRTFSINENRNSLLEPVSIEVGWGLRGNVNVDERGIA